MKNVQILKVSFLVWVVTITIGYFLRIMHHYIRDIFLNLAIFSFLLFSYIGMYEVYTSTRIDKSEKCCGS